MKRFIAVALAFVLVIMTLFTSCTASEQKSSDKKKIVVTNFSEYDWVRNIVGSTEGFEITMLGGGVDLHSFQPSAADIVTITQSDLFIYVGGESDRWVGDVLNSSKNENMEIIALMEIPGVHTRTEEHREGMQAEHEDEDEDEEEEEYDEHVWLSLKNAVVFCENIESILEKLDPDNTDTFRTNLETYKQNLTDLDTRYTNMIKNAQRKVLVFGDRFPFRYLTDDYGLDYYAVFSGCSAETEASFETIKFMANKIDELALDSVITIEGSDKKIAATIIENTKSKSQKILTLNSMQSVGIEEADNGLSYLQVMEDNLSVLTQALN